MRQELILSQRPELRLQLSPQLIQRIEILQLGAADLQELIETELLSNEVLKAEPVPTSTGDTGKSEQVLQAGDQADAENGPTDSESRIDLDQWSRDASLLRTRRAAPSGDRDPKQEALNNTAEGPGTLATHLLEQLDALNLPRDLLLADSKGADLREREVELEGHIQELIGEREQLREQVQRQNGSRSSDSDSELLRLQNRIDELYRVAEYLERDRAELGPSLCHYLARRLDHNGWLTESLEEVLVPLHDYRFDAEHAEAALHIIQGLDPAGVGARSPAECLLLQLDPEHEQRERLRKLITHSLTDLARNRLPKVARDLGESVEEVKELAAILRRDFDPFPGRQFEHMLLRRVRPDVVVEKVEGRYEVQLEDDYMPRLSVDDVRVRIMRKKGMDGELRKQLRRDVESARWLIESIEQRKRTLERVAQEIVQRQEDFLENGINHLKPLKMQEIADELGIHVSTVSRALKGKYIQTPQGVHEMKFFFTGASRGTDGVVESRTGVKERVREIIEAEDRTKPLSDEDIVERLSRMGLKIARRTVTKYRKSLNIPSSRQRREY